MKRPVRDDVLALLHCDHTYAEIARTVGVSREYVRQIANTVDGIKSGSERQQLATAARRAAPASWPKGKWFSNMVRRWLLAIDSGLCGTCRTVVPLAEMNKGEFNTCKRCNAAGVRKHREAHPEVSIRKAEWQRRHPGRCAEYARRWREKKKLKAGAAR